MLAGVRRGAAATEEGGSVTDNNLSAPEWCLGCPYPIYDDRRGEWDW